MKTFLLLLLSLMVVAWGQPAWVPSLGPLAAAFGYALFWKAMLQWEGRWSRFFLAFGWFTTVSTIQLSWMSAVEYVGPFMLAVYAGLAVALGIQFGALSFFFDPKREMDLKRLFAIAGAWVGMEWMRLYLLSGYTWNPVGLALATYRWPLQFSSLFGVYGLSFWVIATNLLMLAAWKGRAVRSLAATFALVPYVFGAAHETLWQTLRPSEKSLTALLVQTSLSPEEKDFSAIQSTSFIQPKEQWIRILQLLKGVERGSVDLIVLPEAAVPFGARRPLYSHEQVKEIWRREVGPQSLSEFPSLESPLALSVAGKWRVTNVFWAQSIANYFGAEVIAGLDDLSAEEKFNAAFFFKPKELKTIRYEKRVLVPITEYIPIQGWRWLSEFVARQFGIEASFKPGEEAKVFPGKVAYGVSICYEETFPHLIRESRKNGAELLVNVTNDVWFPRSKLPRQHFDHGRIRAVENGLCLIRSCNTGMTAVVDPFGRTLASLSPLGPGVLKATFPLYVIPTAFLFWGNGAILLISLFALGLDAIARNRALG